MEGIESDSPRDQQPDGDMETRDYELQAVSRVSAALSGLWDLDAILSVALDNVLKIILTGVTANQGLWDWTVSEDRLYVSPALEHLMGLEDGALGGSEADWEMRVLDEDKTLYTNTLRHYLVQGNSSFAMDFRIRHENDGYRSLLLVSCWRR